MSCYQDALAIYRGTGDRHSEGMILGNLGLVYRELAQYREAIEYYQAALPIRREVGTGPGRRPR